MGKKLYYDPPTSIEPVAGVVKTRYSDYFDVYVGAAQALIASGLITEGQLPRDGRKSAAYWARDKSSACMGSRMTVERRRAGFRVLLRVSQDESYSRWEERQRLKAKQNAIDAKLTRMAPDGEAFRARVLQAVEQVRRLLTGNPDEQFAVSVDACDEIGELLDDVEGLVHEAQITRRRHVREQLEHHLAAACDSGLQAFLAKVQR
jgi:hypothetical protein